MNRIAWPALGALGLVAAPALLAIGLLAERRHAARRDTRREVQREHLATVGEAAASLAHEINQPLAAMTTNAAAARHALHGAAVDPEVREMLDDIAADGQRAARIIRRLRTLLRKEPGDRRPVDVGAVIEEVVALLHVDLESRGVGRTVALQPDAPPVAGDVVQLQQVVLNVVVNAAEAMTDAPGPRALRIDMVVREPGILALTIRDSGSGVPSAELERIFDRFVTTKPRGRGMGLSISRSIVEAHGGRIWATRNPDRGLAVHIELPCLET